MDECRVGGLLVGKSKNWLGFLHDFYWHYELSIS